MSEAKIEMQKTGERKTKHGRNTLRCRLHSLSMLALSWHNDSPPSVLRQIQLT